MNNSSDKKGRKIASYIIPGIITLLVMVFVLIVKGIWPFGSNRIDLFDNWNSYQFLHLSRCLLCQLQCMHFLIEDIRN